jgi:hypothetical protein
MNNFEDRMENYKNKFKQISEEQRVHYQALLKKLGEIYSKVNQSDPMLSQKDSNLAQLSEEIRILKSTPIRGLFDFSQDNRLEQVDHEFIRIFDLNRYYLSASLLYPTIYCETLQEFFDPIIDLQTLSDKQKRDLLDKLCEQAELSAHQGGMYGFNLPGKGCYLNGWLFAKPHDITAKQALEVPQVFERIITTAVHEKLGHGFLDLFSELGKVEASLGANNLKIAEEFGLQAAADPMVQIRQQQYRVLLQSSLFQQEGWATWVESYFDAYLFGKSPHPKYDADELIKAVKDMPDVNKDQKFNKNLTEKSIAIILGLPNPEPELVMWAINALHVIDIEYEEYFTSVLHQPLRYVLGELLMSKIETNLGPVCVPYAALIAGNITLDPSEISLADLRELFTSDASLCPDARLVRIATLKTEVKNNVETLAKMARDNLSLQVPHRLQS